MVRAAGLDLFSLSRSLSVACLKADAEDKYGVDCCFGLELPIAEEASVKVSERKAFFWVQK